jgi:hypothetical protein
MITSGEPFTGVIDEVAIFDFALAATEIAQHWQHSHAGKNYFGSAKQQLPQGDIWKSVALLSAGKGMRFDSVSGTLLGEATAVPKTIWKE